jgi:hypothetical protein
MEPYLEFGYVKCARREKILVAYRDKLGKQSKFLSTKTFSLELKFEQTNSHWKCLKEEKTYIKQKF